MLSKQDFFILTAKIFAFKNELCLDGNKSMGRTAVMVACNVLWKVSLTQKCKEIAGRMYSK